MGNDQSDEKKKQMLSALKTCGGNVTAACQSIGIDPSTYYKWLKRDPSFAEAANEFHGLKKSVESMEAAALAKSLERIVSLLRKQGKYSGELEIQAELTARLIQRFNEIDQEMHSPDYDIMNVEYSREGNSRASVNPLEKLYLEYYDRIHRALRALGMNTDSKERKADNDDFIEKMNEFNRRYDD